MKLLPRFPALLLTLVAPLVADVVILEEIIAKVNGGIILRSEYERALAQNQREVLDDASLSAEQREAQLRAREKDVLRDMIDQRLLVQKGEELGFDVEPQILRQRDEIMRRNNIETTDDFEAWVLERTGEPAEDLMDRMRENFLSQSVLGQEVSQRVVVTREEIEAYYEEHKDEYVRSEGVRLSQILFTLEGDEEAKRKQADEVFTRVQRGEPFAEMARRFSEDEATKELGGDIGIYRRGMLREEIEAAVFGQRQGQIAGLLEVPNGLLILRVDQNYREGLAELEEVQEEIRATISGPRFEPEIRKYLSELRGQSYIEIRPGYADEGAIEGINTAWSDPSRLAPLTTTREEVIRTRRRKRVLWMIPLPREKVDDPDAEEDVQPAPEQAEARAAAL
jgi:parvulin-like peptidyl-prolyl isomerase